MIPRVRKLMKAHPFQPFVVALADGRRFTITSPDMIWLPGDGKGGLHFFVPAEDTIVSLNPLLISSVEWPTSALPTQDSEAA